jgi:hypothetical protein
MTFTHGHQTSPKASAAVRHAGDPFLWGIPLSAFCCGIFLVALDYLERISGGSFVLAVVLFILVVLATLVMAVLALVRGRFMRAAALLIAPVIVGFPYFSPMLGYEEIALDLMRFHLTKGRYTEVIDKLSPAERASRVVIFPWGAEGLAVTATSEYWLVYDESGQIALPEKERSQDWKDRANKEKGYFSDEKCLAEARRLSGHFYSAAMHCPY